MFDVNKEESDKLKKYSIIFAFIGLILWGLILYSVESPLSVKNRTVDNVNGEHTHHGLMHVHVEKQQNTIIVCKNKVNYYLYKSYGRENFIVMTDLRGRVKHCKEEPQH